MMTCGSMTVQPCPICGPLSRQSAYDQRRRISAGIGPGSALSQPVDLRLGAVLGLGRRVLGRLVLAVAPRATAAVSVPALPAGFADHGLILPLRGRMRGGTFTSKYTECGSVRCLAWLWRWM